MAGFQGYFVLPGNKVAEFEIKSPGVVGSRIQVVNTDGSTHVQEIVEWQADQRIEMHMNEFSAPLSRLAPGIEERWDFTRIGCTTRANRSCKLYRKSMMTRPVLWLISILLKKAIAGT